MKAEMERWEGQSPRTELARGKWWEGGRGKKIKGEGTRGTSVVHAEPGQRGTGPGREMPTWEERSRPGGAGWAVVDIKGRPCWISGSGDGYVPISLSNCQKSNLVSGARAGLGLNGGRQA